MPTPKYNCESPDQQDSYEVMDTDDAIALHFPDNPTFLLPAQLPDIVREEFRDKIASSFTKTGPNTVHFPDGSMGQRVTRYGRDQVKIRFENADRIETATYDFATGEREDTETINRPHQAI